MGWWNDRVVPRLADHALKGHEVGAIRGRVCARPPRPGPRGRVRQRPQRSLVPAARSPQVDAVEPSELAWEMSAERRLRSTVPVGSRRAGTPSGSSSPTRPGTAALVTFTLCTIPDAAAALARYAGSSNPAARCTSSSTASPTTRRSRPGSIASSRSSAGWPVGATSPATRRCMIEEAGLAVVEVEQVRPARGAPRPWTAGVLRPRGARLTGADVTDGGDGAAR